jgi:ABC-type lipoprotein export system ATPase subunit/GNAT superfamily N-acetyltransferase
MTNRPTTRAVPTAPAAAWISTPARAACAGFSILPEPAAATPTPIPPDADTLAALARPGVILLTGPSGSGKSRRLAGLLAAQPPSRRVHLARAPDAADLCALDTLGVPGPIAMDAMAAAGLAEPALWLRPASVLSTGERARLALARVIAHARRADLCVCDEFASHLDRATAQALGATASRWARRAGVTLLLASPHADTATFLDTAQTIDARDGRLRPGSPRRPATVRIEPGTRTDLDALARYHYRSGRPATIDRVLRAVRTHPDTGESLAGVLGVSRPTLNAVWREQAWPGRYTNRDRAATARRLNAEVRCISRVIVAPASRGLGVASALVRAYLAGPITPGTEAVAAMGACTPFFRTAGMTEYHLPRPAHDARLADALDHAGLAPTDLITTPPDRLPAFIARELQRWAKHAKVRPTDADPLASGAHIARHAACRLCAQPRAYAHAHFGDPS